MTGVMAEAAAFSFVKWILTEALSNLQELEAEELLVVFAVRMVAPDLAAIEGLVDQWLLLVEEALSRAVIWLALIGQIR